MTTLQKNPTDTETLKKDLLSFFKATNPSDFLWTVIGKYPFLRVRPGFDPLIEAMIHIKSLHPNDQKTLVKLLNE